MFLKWREWRVRSQLLTSLLCIALCSGCESVKDKEVPEAEPVPEAEVAAYTPLPDISDSQRYAKALELLEYGEEAQAKVELEAYLSRYPGRTKAKHILDQITTDPGVYYPSESFPVRLQRGQALVTLAKRYLGDSLQFYALAKYNDIPKPRRVYAGQSIKVPLTPYARRVRDAERAASEAKASAETTETTDIAETTGTEETTEAPETRGTTEATQITELTETTGTTEAKQTGEPTELPPAPVTAPTAASPNEGKETELAELRRARAVQHAEEAGRELDNGDRLAAMNNYTLAVEFDPDNQSYQNDLASLRQEIVDDYHREALLAYRRQQLDESIALWDQLLAIDPDHMDAQLYRAKALDLKNRLKRKSRTTE
jgi:tetratricopeptide (TPR) repeat protein